MRDVIERLWRHPLVRTAGWAALVVIWAVLEVQYRVRRLRAQMS